MNAIQPVLFETEVAEAHGKTVESLRFSRSRRDEIIRLFGGDLPQSIMAAKRDKRKKSMIAGSYYKTSSISGAESDHGKLAEVFDVSGQSVRSGALSAFPQNIGRVMIRLYSIPGDLVVDPFAGHNSRMELTVSEGRHYHGYDISSRFMGFNRALSVDLEQVYGMRIELHHADSRYMAGTPDNIGDFTITSPPYYDLEDYGDEPEQLGKQPTYSAFLHDLSLVAKQNYRVLKHGSFCVWFVNDFRRNGTFYAYHADTMRLLIRAGFTLHDLLVVDLGYPIRAAFATQIVDQHILPKRHEYGLILRKG